MKKTITRIVQLTLPLVVIAVGALSAQAETLVYEGFNGYNSGTMVGQAITATGLTGTYQQVGDNKIVYSSTGLTFGSNFQTSGGSITFGSAAASGSVIGANLNLASSYTGTLYSGYLVNLGSQGASATGRVQVAVNTSATGGNANRYLYTSPDEYTPATYAANHYSNTNFTISSGAAVPALGTETYLVLSRMTNVGMALSGSVTGVMTTWILTLNQYENFVSGGLLDAELDAATIGTASNNVTMRLTGGGETTGQWNFGTAGTALQFTLDGATGSGITPTIDEVRWGTGLGDVAPIPEPTAMASLLVGSFSMLLLSRRSRRLS